MKINENVLMATSRIPRRSSLLIFLSLIMALTFNHFVAESAYTQSFAGEINAGKQALANGMSYEADLHFRQAIPLACNEYNPGAALSTLADCFADMGNYKEAVHVLNLGLTYAQGNIDQLTILRDRAVALQKIGPKWFQEAMEVQFFNIEAQINSAASTQPGNVQF